MKPGAGVPRAAAAAFSLALALTLSAGPALALGKAEKGDCSIEAVGGMRLLAAYLKYPYVPHLFPDKEDGLLAGVTRLILDGDLGSRLTYEVNLYADMSMVPTLLRGGSFTTAGSVASPYRNTYLSWGYLDTDTAQGEFGVDRLSLNLQAGRVQLSAGRFPINYSVTGIFTPNDFFAPFSATAINKIYKPGVDALRLGVTIGMLSSVEVAAVMGSKTDGSPDWGRSALLARTAGVKWNFEWALLGGKLAERWVAGATVQGDIDRFGLRAEGHAGFPDLDGDMVLDDVDGDGESTDDIHGRLAAGLDVMFTWHNVVLGAEYMFLSGGAAKPSRYLARAGRLFPDDIPYAGQHYVGISAGGEIVPILQVQAMALMNVRDLSGMGLLSLAYNAADEIDIIFGYLMPWGKEPSFDVLSPENPVSLESEFGIAPHTLFLESRLYF